MEIRIHDKISIHRYGKLSNKFNLRKMQSVKVLELESMFQFAVWCWGTYAGYHCHLTPSAFSSIPKTPMLGVCRSYCVWLFAPLVSV